MMLKFIVAALMINSIAFALDCPALKAELDTHGISFKNEKTAEIMEDGQQVVGYGLSFNDEQCGSCRYYGNASDRHKVCLKKGACSYLANDILSKYKLKLFKNPTPIDSALSSKLKWQTKYLGDTLCDPDFVDSYSH